MNRVLRTNSMRSASLRLGLAMLLCWMSAGTAQAQLQRLFPSGSLKGVASFGSWPNITINCVPYTLGPGVRVLDAEQRVVLTGQLPGLESAVVFLRDASGSVFRVWLVSPKDPSLATVPNAASNCGFGAG
ncbi:MAG: hypothetical protein ACYCSR_07665 [Thiomonas sp.]|uniref:Uncharacterized protein n=1 Tax=mine drainage metagenome TaxID=410659 RepID=E6PU41_9ZZZZ